MAKPVIDQIVVWAHPFFTAKFTENIRKSELNERELEQALSVILAEMKKTVGSMARRKGTAFVLVKSDFDSVIRTQDGKIQIIGLSEIVGKAYSNFLHHCRQRFGDRFVPLSHEIGYQAKLEEAMERHVEESLRKLKGFTISENLALFRAGEKTGECVFRANSRVANAVKSVFGVEVPKSRMYSVAKHNFGHADAMATLVNAGIEKKFLSHAKRPGPGRKPQWHRPAK